MQLHAGAVRTCKRVCPESWLRKKNPLPHWGIKPASAVCQSDALPTDLHPYMRDVLGTHPCFHIKFTSIFSVCWSHLWHQKDSNILNIKHCITMYMLEKATRTIKRTQTRGKRRSSKTKQKTTVKKTHPITESSWKHDFEKHVRNKF